MKIKTLLESFREIPGKKEWNETYMNRIEMWSHDWLMVTRRAKTVDCEWRFICGATQWGVCHRIFAAACQNTPPGSPTTTAYQTDKKILVPTMTVYQTDKKIPINEFVKLSIDISRNINSDMIKRFDTIKEPTKEEFLGALAKIFKLHIIDLEEIL